MSNAVRRFEDLIAWQKARALAGAVYRATNEGPFARDFGLKDQIRRAAVSAMSNLAEGYERFNPAEFCTFLRIAKASCAEVRSQLYVAFDAGHLNESRFSELLQMAEEVGRLVGGLRASVDRYRESR
jgi:four helix bundle protein